jgi:thymidylate synthase (FAD)
LKTADIKVDYIGHFGDDLSVVNAARVSFEKETFWNMDIAQETGDLVLLDGDVKLINYLAKHKHFSPFNHAFLSFRVKAPIFVARQLVKHKFLPWNEVSRRYVDSEPEFYIPKEFRAKAENVKQGSGGIIKDQDLPYDIQVVSSGALNDYKYMLEKGVCPEMARMVLPLNVMTEWVWSGTLGAFLDMLVLRLDPHTQYESRIVAQQIAAIISDLFPVSYKARIE